MSTHEFLTFALPVLLPHSKWGSKSAIMWYLAADGLSTAMDKVFHCPKVPLAKIFSGEVKLPRLCSLRVHQENLLLFFSGPKSYKNLAYA